MNEPNNWSRRLGLAAGRFYKPAFSVAAVAALIWALQLIGWDKVGLAFASVGVGGAALLLLTGFLESLFDAAALSVGLRARVSFLRVLAISCTGALVNMLALSEMGEVTKGAMLRKHTDTTDAVTATVVWNYAFKITRPGAALLAVALGFVLPTVIQRQELWLALLACVLAFLPFVILWVLLRRGMMELGARFIKLIRLAGQSPEALLEKAKGMDHQIQVYWRERPGAFAAVFGYQFLARLASWAGVWAACLLVGLPYSFATCAVVYGATSVAAIAVMIFPTRIGVTEGAGALVFSLLGLDGGMGLVVNILMRLKAVAGNALGLVFRP
jgi:hypothetical protein